jgi:hypothetical protein
MRERKKLIYSLFIACSIALLALAALVKSHNSKDGEQEVFLNLVGDVLKDVGVVIGALVLVDILWGSVGGDPLSQQIAALAQASRITVDANTTGLYRVHASALEMGSENWVRLIQQTRHRIDIVGYTLYDFMEKKAVRDALLEEARRGVRVNVLLSNPSSPALAQNVDPHKRDTMRQQMTSSLWKLKEMRNSLPPDLKSNLSIRSVVDKGALDIGMRRFDNVMYIVHYSYALSTPDTPVYVIKDENKPLFQTYMRCFDELFSLGQEEVEGGVARPVLPAEVPIREQHQLAEASGPV